MAVRWKVFMTKIGFWLTFEVGLNLIGLDNLADYSEFIFAQDLELDRKNHRSVKVHNYPPIFCIKINENCPIPLVVPKNLGLKSENILDRHPVFEEKCKQLKNPCIKVWCLSNS